MKRSWLIRLKELIMRRSKKPWACFETSAPDKDGKVAFSISYNDAFALRLIEQGMGAATYEETVQMFFLQLRMIPEELVGTEDAVNPDATPNLTNEANQFRRG
jgi:hypothetical protein